MKNGKYIDGIKTDPSTELEVWQRSKNNMTAQFIGESSFSKTIEIAYQERIEKFKCPSYFDEAGKLVDCKCGECK